MPRPPALQNGRVGGGKAQTRRAVPWTPRAKEKWKGSASGFLHVLLVVRPLPGHPPQGHPLPPKHLTLLSHCLSDYRPYFPPFFAHAMQATAGKGFCLLGSVPVR